MARGINIDDLIKNLSFREKKELNDALGDNGIENGKDLIDAFKHMFSDGGGFSDSREKGLFGKFADQKSEYNEAKRLLKSLEELKKGGIDGMTHKEDAELLERIGVDFNNIEESSKEVAKNLKDIKFDNNFVNRVQGLSKGFRDVTSSIKSMGNEINTILDPWAKANDAASKYAKTVAMSASGMKAMTDNTINNVVKSHIGINYNVGTDELIKAQQQYVQSAGRNLSIDNTQQESLAAMHAVMDGKENELAAAFENFGVNLNKTAEHSGKMFDKASRTGISFEKLTDNVAKNIKIAQNYTFKNGLKGLESMAAKAVALKMDMSQVAALADKVSSVEGSIDVASKLQVLGGPFANMADPLGMMNEGLNDMEGLMDRVTKMVGGLGNFNKSTGEVEVSSFNKKRVQAAAQAMGISYDQLMESVNAQAKRGEIEKQIGASSSAKGLSDDMKELLKNTATFDKNGKAGVSINGEFKTLDQLKDSDYDELVKQTQSESDDIKDIAKMLRSYFDTTSGAKKQKEANQAQMTKGIGGVATKLVNTVGQTNLLLKGIVVAQMAGAAMNILGDGLDIVRTFRGGGRGRGLKGLMRNKMPKASQFIGKTTRRIGRTSGGRALRKIRVGRYKAGKGIEKQLIRAKSEIGGNVGRFKGLGRGVGQRAGNVASMGMGYFGNFAGNAMNKLGTKMAGSSSKVLGKMGTNITKNVAKTFGEAGVKTGTKAIGKAAAKSLGKTLMKSALKGGGIGMAFDLAGEGVNMLSDHLVSKGKIKEGGGAHNAMTIGADALKGAGLGATLGSIIPGIGTAVGAAVGGAIGTVVGATKVVKRKRAKALDAQLNELGIQRKGDYGARSLKLIDQGLQTGKLSNRMRKKLLREGDTELLKKIEEKKAEMEEKDEAKKDREAQRQALINGGKGEKVAKRIKNANFIVSNAYFGGKGFGAKSSGFNPLNPLSMLNPLNPISPLIKGSSENGFNPEASKLFNFSKKHDKNSSENSLLNGGKLDVNISGTIKIEANGKQFNMDELMNNQGFKQELAKLISNQIKQNNTQSNRNEKV